RPRRDAWSCLWVLRCSVRSAMRLVSTATWTSAEPVSSSERAYSEMICCFSSLVSVVMFAERGYQRRLPRDRAESDLGHDLPRVGDVHCDRVNQLLHGVVALLVAQPRPELDPQARASQIISIEIQQERLRMQRLDSERWGRSDNHRGPRGPRA